jgi:hypothetical protein
MQYFPMDYIVVGLVVMYIFFTTLSGVTSIGIRALWILLYRIKARATRPQVINSSSSSSRGFATCVNWILTNSYMCLSFSFFFFCVCSVFRVCCWPRSS